MEKKHWGLKTLLACLATALLTALAAAWFFCSSFGGSEAMAMAKKLNAVRTVIEEYYVGETDWDAVTDAAAEAMVDAVGDRWSYYMNADAYLDYLDYSSNTTTGIGVTIQKDEAGGGFLVVTVVEDSPAERAGILPGHVIVSAAGQDVTGLDASGLRDIIKAQEGEYELGLLDGDGQKLTVTLKNEVIYTNPVSYELLDGRVGYIQISNFEEGAAAKAVEAIEDLAAQGMEALIFDVRSNPGGRLAELIDLLDYILPEGEVFVSVDKDGEEKVYTSDESCIDYPMAVLINGNSYSAAEFFAAALREYDYAVVVGQASTGKARSQQTFVLYDGSAVHISTRSYLTPDRVNLAEQGGLTPDIPVELTGEGDAQLEAALKYLS